MITVMTELAKRKRRYKSKSRCSWCGKKISPEAAKEVGVCSVCLDRGKPPVVNELAKRLIDEVVNEAAFEWPKVKIVVKVLDQGRWLPHWLYQARRFVNTIQYKVQSLRYPGDGSYWITRDKIKANRKELNVMNTLTPDPLARYL